MAADRAARAVDAAVVEHAADADIAQRIAFQRRNQALAGGPGAVDDGAAREETAGKAPPRDPGHRGAIGEESDGAAHVPQHQPGAREVGGDLEEEDRRQQQGDGGGPARQQARQLAVGSGERGNVVEPERLEHRHGGKPCQRQGGGVLAEKVGDVEVGDEEAQARDKAEFGRADKSGEDARRDAARPRGRGQRLRRDGGLPGLSRRPRPSAAVKGANPGEPAALRPARHGGPAGDLGDWSGLRHKVKHRPEMARLRMG